MDPYMLSRVSFACISEYRVLHLMDLAYDLRRYGLDYVGITNAPTSSSAFVENDLDLTEQHPGFTLTVGPGVSVISRW